jgi:hypothetical protein
MAEPEVAGIGAVLKPNTPYLKFVDFHPRGAAALSGKVKFEWIPFGLNFSCFLTNV